MRKLSYIITAILFVVLSCKQTRLEAKECCFNDSSKYKIFPILFLKDRNIPQIAKDLYLEKIKPNDSEENLDLLDKLSVKGGENGFYFLVITKTMKHSDGAYSEALGVAAKEYVEQSPTDFLSYFRYNKNLLQDSDLKNWAKCVYSEIQISSEGREREAIGELGELMKSKCANPAYIDEIDRFLELMK